MNKMTVLKKILLLTAILSIIQGCVDPTTITTGAQVVYNRNSLQKTFNDTQTTALAYQKIYTYNDRYKDTNVSISTFNNVMLLAGQTPTLKEKREIDQLVRQVSKPSEIYNLISVSQPISPLTQAGDSWITTKIKSKYIASNDIDPSKIKVVTENGTVYLMGIITHDEADAAVEIARTTDGVQNVVKIFSYITISKL